MPWKAPIHRPLRYETRRRIASAKGRDEYRTDHVGRLYQLPEWKDPRVGLRAMHLAREPLCRECAADGINTPAREVDHVVPHRGDMCLFLDEANLQSLCKPHHSSKTARESNER